MNKSRFSYVSLAAAALAGGVLSFLVADRFAVHGTSDQAGAVVQAAPAPVPCTYIISRVNGFEMVRPVLSSETLCESPRFAPLRNAIAAVIDSCKHAQWITSASVYVREFHSAEWMSYNGNETYDPGSLLKIPVLMTYISLAEQDGALMSRSWTCSAADVSAGQGRLPLFLSEQAQLNGTYTLPKLLDLMIVHSDNRATSILLRNLDQARFNCPA